MLPPIRAYQAQARPSGARRPSSGFALPDAGVPSITGPEAATSSFGVLGLEQGWTPAERDAAAQRRGTAVLRELEALQLSVLGGGIAAAQLSRLALLTEGEAGADPALREILAEISLRAQVELARRLR
jgi:hypothetical protein